MPQKPNLLFLFTDEQRYDTMRCYGNDWIVTPNLNALAEQSFVFDRTYVAQAICTPSRASILTGLYPHAHGCVGNGIALRPEIPTLAEMIDPEYRRCYMGKWHLGGELTPQHGFEQWVSTEDFYRGQYTQPEDLQRTSDYHQFLLSQGLEPDAEDHGAKVFGRTRAARLPEPLTKAHFTADRAAEFIRDNAARPFALYVNFLEPHMPFTGPLDNFYRPEDLPTGSQFYVPPPPEASFLHRKMAESFLKCIKWPGRDYETREGWQRVRARYMGLITMVDRAVGKILAALRDSGAADRTIVVFTSDHGDMMGDHGMFTKAVNYEQAMRVPLLVRVPWLAQPGRRIEGRISQVDLVPALLELMGEPLPARLQGHSRAPTLRDGGHMADNDVIVEWNSSNARTHIKDVTPEQQACLNAPWRTIISRDGWKLNLSPLDQCELYDLNNDPQEVRNLYNAPEQRDRIRDLAGRIRRWQQRTGDTAPLPAV